MKNKIDLELLHSGKVRDIYNIDDDLMLMVASDRISAFDSVFDEKITGKGATLTKIANFWFDKTSHIVPNHLTNIDPNKFGNFNGEAIVVKKLKPLPIEAIVRGYIIGSGWNDYQKTGSICGIELAKNLQLAQKLDKPIYTPSSKAEVGDHDENISFAKTIDLVGKDLAEKLRDVSIKLYEFARGYADLKGIIIADTKFEFGLDKNDNLVLMDEVLTPDSSRFWDKKLYKVGTSPASFDKQILRDYLNSTDWDKNPPAPQLPQDILDKTASKYQQVVSILL
jgi:phosphoribosylaminoimidazole-succinocarboxamide synthase